MSKTKAIRRLVLLSLFIGIEVVLMCTPLGYIPIGAIKATTLHIPVIVISIILGVKEGAILGFVFGMSSLIMSTINPSLFSFCFSPFYSIGDIHGNFGSVLIALVPRILLGIIPGVLYRLLSKKMNSEISSGCASFIATICHTAMVMFGIYFFFGKEYAASANFAYETFLFVIKTTILTNGVLEAVLAVIVTMAIIKAFKAKGVLHE